MLSDEEKKKRKKEKQRIADKKYRENNKEKVKETQRKYRENNKEKIKIYNEIYRNKEENKIKMNEYNIKFYNDNKERERERILIYKKKYHEENKDIEKEKRKANDKKRKTNDKIYNLRETIRNSINKSIKRKGYKKSSRTHEILGCSFEFFKEYIEKQFEPWMNWENKGKYDGSFDFGWDLDHIIPISSAKTEEEVLKLNHYTNFQPLCSKVNRDIKKDKLDY